MPKVPREQSKRAKANPTTIIRPTPLGDEKLSGVKENGCSFTLKSAAQGRKIGMCDKKLSGVKENRVSFRLKSAVQGRKIGSEGTTSLRRATKTEIISVFPFTLKIRYAGQQKRK